MSLPQQLLNLSYSGRPSLSAVEGTALSSKRKAPNRRVRTYLASGHRHVLSFPLAREEESPVGFVLSTPSSKKLGHRPQTSDNEGPDTGTAEFSGSTLEICLKS